MGNKIRAEIESGSELGQKIKVMNDAGTLVPDELMIQIIKNCGEQAKETGMVFDGFPRMVPQAIMLDEILGKVETKIDKFFYLRVSQEEAIKRLNARAELTGRADDKDIEVVKNRLGVFQEQSTALINYYREQGKLVEVDGEKSIEEVYKEICENLNK
jgi:adenylate kinase